MKWNAKVLKSLLVLIAAGSLYGCGSSDYTVTATGPQGRLVQGPVVGATVYADRLVGGTRFVRDSDEVFTTTDANGDFAFETPPTYSHVLVSTGGTDRITGQAAIQMIAPAGSKNVTPLTTLVALDTSGTVKAKIEGMMGGAKFDADVSTAATPATLLLVKSVETVVQSLTATIANEGASISSVQLASVQADALKSIATTLADPAVTATTLSTPAALNTTMATAVTDSITSINANNSNITIAPAAAATIATNAVSAAAATISSSIFSAAPVSTSTTVAEASVVTAATFTTAVSSTVTATASLTTATATPTNYTPPVITVVVVPAVSAVTPADATVLAAGTKPVISITFTEAMTADSTAGSITNSANWTVRNGSTPISGTISYDAATKTATFTPTAGTTVSGAATVTVTVKQAVKSAAGVALVNDVIWSFQNGPTGTTGSSSIINF